MRSLTIVIALALLELGLVTANFYNFYASEWSSNRSVALRIFRQPIELSTLQAEPSVSVATLRTTRGDDTAEFWVDDTIEAILHGSISAYLHAGFDKNGPGGLSYTPIYFVEKTVEGVEKTVKGEEIVTRVHGHTIVHAKGFGRDNESRIPKLTYGDDTHKFAFCPSPFGDVVVVGSEPYTNNAGQVLILSVLEQGFAQAAGCIPAFVFARNTGGRVASETGDQ